MKLTHIDAQSEPLLNVDGSCTQAFDLFVVTDEDSGLTVEVMLFHADDDHIDSITIDNSIACLLPNIYGSLHLIACVSMTVLKYFTEDCDFYSSGFYDDNGYPIDRELILLPL